MLDYLLTPKDLCVAIFAEYIVAHPDVSEMDLHIERYTNVIDNPLISHRNDSVRNTAIALARFSLPGVDLKDEIPNFMRKLYWLSMELEPIPGHGGRRPGGYIGTFDHENVQTRIFSSLDQTARTLFHATSNSPIAVTHTPASKLHSKLPRPQTAEIGSCFGSQVSMRSAPSS